jgi:archaetidylinositol phosphate synthase
VDRETAPPRIHRSILVAAESKLLALLAAKLPSWVAPDLLTAAGLLGALAVFAGYLLSSRDPGYLWLANLGLVVHWFGDSMDGTLARFRRRERPKYGFFLDQSIDVVANILIMAGAGLSPFMRMDTALLALAGYHALSIHSLIQISVSGRFPVSLAGLGPTEVRIGLFALNAGIFFGGAPGGFLGLPQFTWCDGLLLVSFSVMAVMFVASFITDARRLRDDPADRS